MFHKQPFWKPALRLIIVLVVSASLVCSIANQWYFHLSVISFNFYGLFVLIRMIVQIILAQKNNTHVQSLVRSKILMAIEKKEDICFSSKEKRILLKSPDFRLFRSKLQKALPHLANQAIWSTLMTQVFIDLGFPSIDNLPPVFIEIPIYHPESLQEVAQTVASLRYQTYPTIHEILLCFNDPQNRKMKQQLTQYVTEVQRDDNRVRFLSLPISSKRSAMYAGFLRHISHFQTAIKNCPEITSNNKNINQIIKKIATYSFQEIAQMNSALNTISVNVDADTQVDPDAIALGVLLLLLDSKTAAITSNVEIRNANHNFLTHLTAARYKSANVVERAAQSSMHAVRCMSGPFMMFWTSNLMSLSARKTPLVTEWVTETFLKVKVEPGDDRSWTVRQNEQGFGVRFHPDIVVTTDCPVSWKRWKKQQIRWMRSGNRNFIISLPFLFKLPLFIIFDDLYLFFFPLLLFLISLQLVWRVIQSTHSLSAILMVLFPYLLTIFFIQCCRSIHLALSEKNAQLLWLSCYFLVYLRYLIWLRIISFATITQSEWTGRTRADFIADQVALKGDTM